MGADLISFGYNVKESGNTSPFVEDVLSASHQLDIKVWGQGNQIFVSSQLEGHFKVWTLNGSILANGPLKKGDTPINIHQNKVCIVAIETEEGISTYKVKVGM